MVCRVVGFPADVEPLPQPVAGLRGSIYRGKSHTAMKLELDRHQNDRTNEAAAPSNRGENLYGQGCMLLHKQSPNCLRAKLKARLLAKEFSQAQNGDYFERTHQLPFQRQAEIWWLWLIRRHCEYSVLDVAPALFARTLTAKTCRCMYTNGILGRAVGCRPQQVTVLSDTEWMVVSRSTGRHGCRVWHTGV